MYYLEKARDTGSLCIISYDCLRIHNYLQKIRKDEGRNFLEGELWEMRANKACLSKLRKADPDGLFLSGPALGGRACGYHGFPFGGL